MTEKVMTMRSYLWSLRLCTLVLFLVWILIVLLTDPQDIGMIAYPLFYITFFCFTSGIGILAMSVLHHHRASQVIGVTELSMALRQGILIGLLLTIMLVLQQFSILAWWDALLVLCGIFLIELYFLTRTST